MSANVYLQVWWKSECTRFGKLILSCSVSIQFICHHTCHYISRCKMCQFNCKYGYFLNAKCICVFFSPNTFLGADEGGAAVQPCTFHFLYLWQQVIEFFFLYFQLKLVSTTAVLAAAGGSASSDSTDPVPPLLIPQCSCILFALVVVSTVRKRC